MPGHDPQEPLTPREVLIAFQGFQKLMDERFKAQERALELALSANKWFIGLAIPTALSIASLVIAIMSMRAK